MAGLTKQHFNKIAELLCFYYRRMDYFRNDINSVDGFREFNWLLEELIKYLKTQNPLFNENQFKKSCLK